MTAALDDVMVDTETRKNASRTGESQPHPLAHIAPHKNKEESDRAQSLATQQAYLSLALAAQEGHALEIMGLDPATNFDAQNFTIPNFIRTTPSNSNGSNTIYNIAVKYLGTPYVWGGTSLKNGCDCSGLIKGITHEACGIDLSHSSQTQTGEIANLTGQKPYHTTCRNITADQISNISDNVVMTMGPKNGIGHVVIVTKNNQGERVVLQSMGHVGVCEMPLGKFIEYLHRQPAGRLLEAVDYNPLLGLESKHDTRIAPVVASASHTTTSKEHKPFLLDSSMISSQQPLGRRYMPEVTQTHVPPNIAAATTVQSTPVMPRV